MELKESKDVLPDSPNEAKEDPTYEAQCPSSTYLTGPGLVATMTSLTLASYLVLLDASIVSTVGHAPLSSNLPLRPEGDPSHYFRLPFAE
jgi:hypothetical protein